MTIEQLLDPVAFPLATVNVQTSWQFLIGPNNVGPQYELTQATSRVLTYHIDESASLALTLQQSDQALQYIQELVTDVWVYRNGRLLFRGRVGTTTDHIDGETNTYTIDVNIFDYREWLARQFLQPSRVWSWRGKTQAQIIQDLFTYVINGQSGIKPVWTIDTSKMPASTVNFDTTPGTSVKDVIGTLPSVGWRVFPNSSLGVTLRAISPWYYNLNHTFVAEFGSTLDKVDRTYDTSGFADSVIYTGDMNLAPIQSDAANISTAPQGRLGAVQSNPAIVDKAHLQSAANSAATNSQNVVPTWQCHMKPGIWVDDTTCWTGDICQFIVKKGRLNINDQYRITDITINVSDDAALGDDITLTFAKPAYIPPS